MTTPQVYDSAPVKWCCAILLGIYAGILVILWIEVAFLHLVDFTTLWAAARLALAGKAAAAYDWSAIRALQPFPVGFQDFYYPPFFLLVLLPFGLLPYTPAAALWLATTTAFYLAAVRTILRGPTVVLAALAAPPFLIDFSWGQNGLLAASLLGGGLALLDRRPLTAGVLIGFLAYKPHYGLLLPLFLAITGRWRVFAAAAVTVIALVAAATAAFGSEPWAAFAGALQGAGGRMAAAMHWDLLASVYAVLQRLGCGVLVAGTVHAAIAAAAAVGALLLAAGTARDDLKFAALATAAMLIPPYSEPADWSILSFAVAFLVRDGLGRPLPDWQKPALVTVYSLPLINMLSRAAVPGWFAEPVMGAVLAALIAARAGPVIGRRLAGEVEAG
jgi:Glycosyltransferase family 87